MRDHSPWDGEGFRLKKNPGPVPGSPEKRKKRNYRKMALYSNLAVVNAREPRLTIPYLAARAKPLHCIVAKPLVYSKLFDIISTSNHCTFPLKVTGSMISIHCIL